ncbi:hypothetical protein [Flavobacterium psychrotolerans]|uniref:Uncharacterized protein n=1 Tax=Flavobacterium psychrotolerans TaxID=2169410 RepID=A0A2U1JK22_9FLAO|nr:hypothetical protein [Flavobacterium psychrotolerans]PWA05355.1 hypothetical protein DB895_07080 [Flavobacterium psychrotolerans]
MDCNNIEELLEKYFQGGTSIAEEQELRKYFSSSNVLPHLEQYKPLFGYFSLVKKEEFEREILPQTKKYNLAWLSIAASVVVLLGIGTYVYLNNNKANQNQDLGTYDDPEVAYRETQKALALLSNHVNVGIESVQYVQEYQNSKNLIFKQ